MADNPEIINAFIEDGEVKLPGNDKFRPNKNKKPPKELFDFVITLKSLQEPGKKEEAIKKAS